MKIALISHLYPTKLYPHRGKFIQDQYNLLNDHGGNEVDLIVPTPYSLPFTERWKATHSELSGNFPQSGRVSYLSFPKKRFPNIIKGSLSKKLLDVLLQKQYDLIHIHWAYPDGLIIPDLKKAGFKTVLTIHGSDWYQNLDNSSLFPLIKESLINVDRVLYSGPQLKSDIESHLPELSRKSDVIYNYVNSESYTPVSKESKKELRTELGWSDSNPHAFTVANIRHEKGIDLLVDTIINNEKLSHIQFHILGGSENSEYFRTVLKKIEQNPFNNIEILPPVKPSELIKFYRAAHFYILPSRREGFNVSILEAASCGLPLLCTDVGGNKEVIERGTGILLSDSIDKQPQSILELSKTYHDYDPQTLHQLIKEHYGKASFYDSLIKNYKLVLDY